MDEFGQALLVTAALLALGLVVDLIVLIIRAVALQRLIARVAAGTLSRGAAITHSRRLARRALSPVATAAALAPVLTLGIPWASGSFLVDPHLWFGIFGVVCPWTLFAYSVLGSVAIDTRVRRSLRGLNPPTAQTAVIFLKAGLISYLPITLACVGLTAAFAGGSALGVWLLCLVAVAWRTIVVLFLGHHYRFVNPTRPVDAAAVPGLKERVELWAARCGAAQPDVRILQTATLGVANIAQFGILDRTLLVSDNTLTAMDWRQRDAFIVRAILASRSAGSYVLVPISVEAFTYGLIGFAFTTSMADPATSSLFAIVVLMGFPALFRLITRQGTGNPSRLDSSVAEVTGDPLAVMVGMNTLATLNDAPDGLSNTGVPLTPLEDRIRALDAWMQQPGPQAPWAYQPVPSRWPVTVGWYLLTAPLESAPPPAPVPTTPYAALTSVAP